MKKIDNVDVNFSLDSLIETLKSNDNRLTITLKNSRWNDHVSKANQDSSITFDVNDNLSQDKIDMIQYFFDNEDEIYQSCFDYWKLNFLSLAKDSIFYDVNEEDKEWIDSITEITDKLVEQSFGLWDIVIKSKSILLRIDSMFHLDTVEMKIKENKVVSLNEL